LFCFDYSIEEEYFKDIPTVPNNNPPLRQNFIFNVPEASVPAVEIGGNDRATLIIR